MKGVFEIRPVMLKYSTICPGGKILTPVKKKKDFYNPVKNKKKMFTYPAANQLNLD